MKLASPIPSLTKLTDRFDIAAPIDRKHPRAHVAKTAVARCRARPARTLNGTESIPLWQRSGNTASDQPRVRREIEAADYALPPSLFELRRTSRLQSARASLFRLQLTYDGRSLCTIDLIEGSAGKA